jgi:hypothetical protein
MFESILYDSEIFCYLKSGRKKTNTAPIVSQTKHRYNPYCTTTEAQKTVLFLFFYIRDIIFLIKIFLSNRIFFPAL